MFENKTWWVTGASSGIGEALAAELALQGASLILSGRNEAALAAVARRTGGRSRVLPFEATDFDRLPEIVERAWTWSGSAGIHGLVNNAGISQRSLAVETVFEVYRRIVDVDLLGPIALTQRLLPRMVAAGGGQVVAISSVAGIFGVPMRSAYCAAKHGLIGYHDAVRAETAHQNIRVLVVTPGSVRTNVSRNALGANAERRGFSDAAIENGMAPDEVARRMIEALRAGQRELVLADGVEAEMTRLRRSDPDALFDRMAAWMAAGYAKQLGEAGIDR